MLDELVTSESIAAEVFLQRSARAGAIILLEGTDDKRLFRKFFVVPPEHLIPCGGFLTAVAALELISKKEETYTYGVVDSDRLHEAPDPVKANLAGTDHRADVLVLATDEVLMDICIEVSGGLAGDDDHRACLESAVEAASVVGQLRRASQEHRLGLKMSNFPIGEAWRGEGAIDLDAVIDLAIARTKVERPTKAQVLSALTHSTGVDGAAPIRFCQGHDLAKALSIVMTNRWTGADVGAKLVLRLARVAYRSQHFEKTQLYRRLREFEVRDDVAILRRPA